MSLIKPRPERARHFNRGASDPYAAYRTSLYEFWPLNESAATSDAIGKLGVYDVTKVNDPGVGGSGIGTAYRTSNGSNQYFSKLANASLASYGEDMWISAWFYASGLSGIRQIASSRDAGSANGTLSWILRTEIANLVFYLGTGLNADLWASPALAVVTAGVWNHAAITCRASDKKVKVSINGGAVTEYTSTKYPTIVAGTEKFCIMGDVLELWNGRVKCVAKGHGTAAGAFLSDALLQGLYNGGTPIIF